ncbi:MAG: hypothetical protein AB7K24_20200 [Gemmataceae bacterium]
MQEAQQAGRPDGFAVTGHQLAQKVNGEASPAAQGGQRTSGQAGRFFQRANFKVDQDDSLAERFGQTRQRGVESTPEGLALSRRPPHHYS